MPSGNNIAISFEIGDIASAVGGIDSLAASMARLGQASGSAFQPIRNPFDSLLTGLSALPNAVGRAAGALRGLSGAIEGLYNLAGTAGQRQFDFGVSQKNLGSSAATTAVLQGFG